MDALALDVFVARQGGVVTVGELRESYSRADIVEALQQGHLVRLQRTLLALPGLGRARVEAIRHRGLISHLSAAAAHGWKVKQPPERPSITVPYGRKLRGSSTAEIHYAKVPIAEPGSVTDKVTTVIDCARALPFDEGLCLADSALRSGAVSRSELVTAAEQSARTGRSRVLQVIRHADGRSANPFESVLRALALEVPGFTARAQCPVAGVGRCDVGDLDLRIALEAESFEFHALKEAFNYDIRRYTEMSRRGWLVARFLWDDVMHRPQYVREVVADLMAHRTTRTI